MFKKETLQMPYIHHRARNKLCRFVGGGGGTKGSIHCNVSERHHTVILNFKSVFFCSVRSRANLNQIRDYDVEGQVL